MTGPGGTSNTCVGEVTLSLLEDEDDDLAVAVCEGGCW